MAEGLKLDLVAVKRDLILANTEINQRGLLQSAKWTAELIFALDQIKTSDVLDRSKFLDKDFVEEYDHYTLVKTYFDLQEYDRAAYFSEHCKHPKISFLHYYSRYLAGEKRKLNDMTDSIGPDKVENEHLRALRLDLHNKHKELDGYSLYLYGIVLKKLDLVKDAIHILEEAINKEPTHWGAWHELAQISPDRTVLSSLQLPDHWMKHFFLAHAYLELQLNDESLRILQSLQQAGFSKSTYLISQLAVANHNIRDVENALKSFSELQKLDPYRLDNMDTYSNLLYIKEMLPELAHLAHQCSDIDKYKVETCCVIGNFYSLRAEHEKAVLYFQRALKLNPQYLSAWTLMGHEFMEMKNVSAAIQAYRQAIEVNRRDYRAWYGLGQTYEILKMPFYGLYYHRQAQMLRPNDSRMVVALGECYEKLGKLQDAKKCFWKAHAIGDVEGNALIRLAKLYEKLKEEQQAAMAFTEYINETTRDGAYSLEEQAHAFRFLANYHIKHNQLDDAYIAAQKCTEFNETREEGKSLLRQITRLRSLGEPSAGAGIPAEEPEMSNNRLTIEGASSPTGRLSPVNLTFM